MWKEKTDILFCLQFITTYICIIKQSEYKLNNHTIMKYFVSILVAAMVTLPMNAKISKGVEVDASSVNKTEVYNFINDNNECMKYDYAIDNDGRVIAKTAYRWNTLGNEWVPQYIYTVTFGTDSNIMTYAKWDATKKAFSAQKQQVEYATSVDPITLPTE